jgi:hypothetical protein
MTKFLLTAVAVIALTTPAMAFYTERCAATIKMRGQRQSG